jgi:hypothetical protein
MGRKKYRADVRAGTIFERFVFSPCRITGDDKMSQELVSQKVKRTCEGCGFEETYELFPPTPEVAIALTRWYQTAKRVIFPNGEQLEMQVMACSLTCLEPAAAKMVPPVAEPSSEPTIDLASLQVGHPVSDVN